MNCHAIVCGFTQKIHHHYRQYGVHKDDFNRRVKGFINKALQM